MTDPLRLKQVVMNLASNSRKFVTAGFIRIGVFLKTDGTVSLYVEDSGPGIPLAKRQKLFARYQDSLDTLSQGTGMGLCLSKQIVDLLRGELDLDENYDSGVVGFPGSRFVLDLKRKPETSVAPVSTMQETNCEIVRQIETPENAARPNDLAHVLPEDLSVLIVDDDMILRRLISRSLKRIAPSWSIFQASNGETALRMSAEQDFDVIFLDQYMASVEKQLLGTETANAMRAQGVSSCICGLSANQIEELFLQAGADAFIQKPFPCEKETLTKEVTRVLGSSLAARIEI